MAMSMGPPMLPGFSLRVQLYSPHAHSFTDKPLRCFRVVTSPESTVREFCEETSRIHEINYGEPIAIKKCQDDQEFDITQAEILGSLFANAATIRVIQAPAIPGVRDSVPPTSALRYDPANLSRKREREGSARPNGSASSSTWRPNKRQRISDLDPDQPLQSRERDHDVGGTIDEEEEPRDDIIPNSQHEAAYAGKRGNSRHVRDDVRRISETPSPPPELPDFAHFENGSADRQGLKSNATNTNDIPMSQISIPSPFGPASARVQNSAKSKSASYHIQRTTGRGTSVSTAATSPLSADQQALTMNGSKSSNKRKISDPILEVPKTNGKLSLRSEIEESIYDNVPSDSEGSAILRRTKEKLKGKTGSPSGLPGIEWSKKFNTPPNGSRRTSRSQERTTSNGELPLTPNSKEHEERQLQKEQADEARKARVAAAEAAEHRKSKADEARKAEDRERIRLLREKSNRKAQEERNAVIAKAARLEKERLEQMKLEEEREAEESRPEQERIREEAEQEEHAEREKQARIGKERQEAEILEKEKQALIRRDNQEAERFQREKAKAEEDERVREEEIKRRAKQTTLAVEEMRKSREQSEQSKASTPDRSKATPIRPQSSTPFIPSGRKSALKAPSSQTAAGSSPALVRTVSAASSTESKGDLEPPVKAKRKVSFDVEENSKVTPVRPPILPPSRASASKPAPAPTPKASTLKPPPVTTKDPSPKASERSSVRYMKQSTTPILPPSARRSATPLIQSTIVPPSLGITTKPAVTNAILPVTKSISPAARSRVMSVCSTKSKEPDKCPSPPAVQVTVSSEEESEEGDDEDEDEDDEDLVGPSRIDPVQALNSSLHSPAKSKSEMIPNSHEQDDNEEEEEEEEEEEDEDEDGEMQDVQSNRSSSRSPIMFNSNPTPGKSEPAKLVQSVSSTSDESNDEDESVDENESADGEVEVSEEEDEDGDKTITTAVPRSSPPALALSKPTVNMSHGDSGQPSSVAVKSTPIPIPSSSHVATPRFTIGASLSSLNAKRPILGFSASKANGKAQPLKLTNNDNDDSEEDSEESDSDSSSDSDNGNEPEPFQTLPKHKQPRPADTSSDDSSSDSDSEFGSEKENEEEEEIARNELAAQIAKMTSDSQASTQSYDLPGPKLVKAPQSGKSSGKKVNGGSEKFLTGYAFSQPK